MVSCSSSALRVAQSTVAKYMAGKADPSGQRWSTFLRNHSPHIAAMDLFVVPTIGFNLLYVLVIVRLARREFVWLNVTAHPTAEWIAQQITEAFPWTEAPRYLIRDRDAIYGAAVTRRLRAMGIRDKPIAPGSPWQNSFAERLIGTIRRECVDHVIALGEHHLRRSRAQFSGLDASCRMPWLAGFITSTSESNFSVHTGTYRAPGRIEALLTGYFEPIVAGSRFPTPEFHVPLYRRPRDLEAAGYKPGSLAFPNEGVRIGRRNDKNELVPYHDRAVIDQSCLAGQAPSCCIREKRLATPQCSVILPSRTRMTSTVSN